MPTPEMTPLPLTESNASLMYPPRLTRNSYFPGKHTTQAIVNRPRRYVSINERNTAGGVRCSKPVVVTVSDTLQDFAHSTVLITFLVYIYAEL